MYGDQRFTQYLHYKYGIYLTIYTCVRLTYKSFTNLVFLELKEKIHLLHACTHTLFYFFFRNYVPI